MGLMNVVAEAGVMMIVELNGITVVVGDVMQWMVHGPMWTQM